MRAFGITVLMAAALTVAGVVSARDPLEPPPPFPTEPLTDTDRAALSFISSQIGDTFVANTVRDQEMEAYLKRVIDRLIPHEDQPEWTELTIAILRQKSVNAFALPHGRVFIHTGMLPHLENEDQLAFLVGHEIAHVLYRHPLEGARAYYNYTVLQKMGPLGTALLLPWANQVTGWGTIAAMQSYSRSREAACDHASLWWMQEAGYDSSEARKIFELFQEQEERFPHRPPEWLRSHPTNENRIARVEAMIGATKPVREKPPPTEFLTMMWEPRYEGAASLADTREYERAAHVYDSLVGVKPDHAEAQVRHAEALRLWADQLDLVIDGLRRTERGTLVKGTLSDEAMTLNPDITTEKAARAKQQELHARAEKQYRRALTLDASQVEARWGLALVSNRLGRPDEALKHVELYLQSENLSADRRAEAEEAKRYLQGRIANARN